MMTTAEGTKTLEIGDGLELPVAAVTRTVAVVGQKGTGKTSTAVVIVEEAAAAGARFAWLDPTGAASGLRSNRAGDGPGLDCVVMGGFNADVPLSPSAGDVVARLVVEEGYSVVCDMERMPRSEQILFVASFAETAYELCRSAVTIVVDEAQRFVPQAGGAAGGSKEEKEDLGRCRQALTEIVMLGRRKGLGSVLISQRPAKLHKDVLEQADVLIAHRLMGNNDRGAVAGWLEDYGQDADDWLGELSRVKRGRAIVLAPEYDVAGVFAIRMKHTFDSSAEPEVGEVILDAPRARSEIDLSALEEKMGHALEEAQESDPEHLRRKIAKLEQELADGAGGEIDPAELEDRVAERVGDLELDLGEARERVHNLEGALEALNLRYGFVEGRIRDLIGQHAPILKQVGQIHDALETFAGDVTRELETQETEGPTEPTATTARDARADLPALRAADAKHGTERIQRNRTREDRRDRAPAAPAPDPRAEDDTLPPLKAGARRMLAVLLASPRRLERGELATLADVRKGGTMSDYLSALRAHGLLDETEDGLAVSGRWAGPGRTDVARKLVSDQTFWKTSRSPAEIIRPHEPKLKAGARRMLEHLMKARRTGFTRSELSRLADVSKGGTFSDYLSALKTRGLAVERAKRVYVGDILYLWED